MIVRGKAVQAILFSFRILSLILPGLWYKNFNRLPSVSKFHTFWTLLSNFSPHLYVFPFHEFEHSHARFTCPTIAVALLASFLSLFLSPEEGHNLAVASLWTRSLFTYLNFLLDVSLLLVHNINLEHFPFSLPGSIVIKFLLQKNSPVPNIPISLLSTQLLHLHV